MVKAWKVVWAYERLRDTERWSLNIDNDTFSIIYKPGEWVNPAVPGTALFCYDDLYKAMYEASERASDGIVTQVWECEIEPWDGQQIQYISSIYVDASDMRRFWQDGHYATGQPGYRKDTLHVYAVPDHTIFAKSVKLTQMVAEYAP